MALVLQGFKRIILPVAALLLVLIGLGLLVTKVLADSWPVTAEDEINRDLASDRTNAFNKISDVGSFLADTPTVILVTAVSAVLLAAALHRWREPVFLCAAVTAQALVFFLTTLVIDRNRPAVRHLDDSPPTSSFPSGHTSASVALYGGLAVLVAAMVRRTWVTWLAWALLLLPVSVAVARIYRGMHHPTDVVGSFINGGVCLYIMARGILDRSVSWTRSKTGVSSAARPTVSSRQPA